MRRNLEITGIAGDFINKIPIRKRGQVISLIVSHALTNGTVKESLASVFTENELSSFSSVAPKATMDSKQPMVIEEKVGDSLKEDLNKENGSSQTPKFSVQI